MCYSDASVTIQFHSVTLFSVFTVTLIPVFSHVCIVFCGVHNTVFPVIIVSVSESTCSISSQCVSVHSVFGQFTLFPCSDVSVYSVYSRNGPHYHICW